MITKLNKKFDFNAKRKLKGAVFQFDILYYLIAILFFMAIAVFAWPLFRDFVRTGSEWLELQSMQSAAGEYEALHINANSPSSAADLINGLTADESIDGAAHTGLMTGKSGRWANGSYLDAWGQDFVFGEDSDGTHYITSNGPDQAYGTDDDLTVYY